MDNGFYYEGKKDNDPLIKYYKKEFDKKFSRAREIKLDKNGRVKYTDNILRKCYGDFQSINAKDWMILIIGSILGFILSTILSAVFEME